MRIQSSSLSFLGIRRAFHKARPGATASDRQHKGRTIQKTDAVEGKGPSLQQQESRTANSGGLCITHSQLAHWSTGQRMFVLICSVREKNKSCHTLSPNPRERKGFHAIKTNPLAWSRIFICRNLSKHRIANVSPTITPRCPP